MQARDHTHIDKSAEQAYFFVNPETNSFSAAIKAAATELAKVKTQARISQQPKSFFLKNNYRNSHILFLYDFYKEPDLDNCKIFIESFYTVIEQIVSHLQQTSAANTKHQVDARETKGIDPFLRAKNPIQMSKENETAPDTYRNQLQEVEMDILLAFKSLIGVKQNLKRFFINQKDSIDATGFDINERVIFNDDNRLGREIVGSIYPIFINLEKALKLLQDIMPTHNATQETQPTGATRRTSTVEAPALKGEPEESLYASAETFAQKQGLSSREHIPDFVWGSALGGSSNKLTFENDSKSIIELL